MRDETGGGLNRRDDGGEVFHRVVTQVFHQMHRSHVRAGGAEQDRVAVGLGAGDLLGRYRAVGARSILEDDGNLEDFLQLRCHGTAHEVGRPGRKADDDADSFLGPRLGDRGRGQSEREQREGAGADTCHGIPQGGGAVSRKYHQRVREKMQFRENPNYVMIFRVPTLRTKSKSVQMGERQ